MLRHILENSEQISRQYIGWCQIGQPPICHRKTATHKLKESIHRRRLLKLDWRLPMIYSGPHIQGARVTEDYPSLFGDNYGTAETYGQSTPLFDAICYPYPASNHPVSSLHEADNNGYQLSYNGGANWLSNYDSGFGGRWGENLFSYNYSTDDKEYDIGKEDHLQNEEHHDIDFSYHEDNDNQPAVDYNSCYDSCSACIEEIFNYREQEPRPAHGSSLEEMRFCEGIFGYWPCLLREMRLNYQQ